MKYSPHLHIAKDSPLFGSYIEKSFARPGINDGDTLVVLDFLVILASTAMNVKNILNGSKNVAIEGGNGGSYQRSW